MLNVRRYRTFENGFQLRLIRTSARGVNNISEIGSTLKVERAFLHLDSKTSGSKMSEEDTKTNEILLEIGTGYNDIVDMSDDYMNPLQNCVRFCLENSLNFVEAEQKACIAKESIVRRQHKALTRLLVDLHQKKCVRKVDLRNEISTRQGRTKLFQIIKMIALYLRIRVDCDFEIATNSNGSITFMNRNHRRQTALGSL